MRRVVLSALLIAAALALVLVILLRSEPSPRPDESDDETAESAPAPGQATAARNPEAAPDHAPQRAPSEPQPTTTDAAPSPSVPSPASPTASNTAPSPSVAGTPSTPQPAATHAAETKPDGGDEEPVFPVTQDGLREAMGFKKYEMRECYDEWLKLMPDLAGRTKVRFELHRTEEGGTGMRDVSLVDSELQQTAFEGCIVSVVRSMRFDPMEEESLKVVYPLVFAASERK